MQNYNGLNLKVNASLKCLWYLQKLCIVGLKNSLENLSQTFETLKVPFHLHIINSKMLQNSEFCERGYYRKYQAYIFIFFVFVGMSYCSLMENIFQYHIDLLIHIKRQIIDQNITCILNPRYLVKVLISFLFILGFIELSPIQQALIYSFCENHEAAIQMLDGATLNRPEINMIILLAKTQMKAKRNKVQSLE